jgi:hypothetical protein
MADGRIASIGWIGIHAPEFSNAIFAFNPRKQSVELLAPWEQWKSASDLTDLIPPRRGVGYNKHHGTYDNHPSAYFAATNSLCWFGHGVFDVTTGKHIRGSRPPQTRRWNTYATGFDMMENVYNPAYAQCIALSEVAFFGASSGGSGSPFQLVVWRNTGPPDAPWRATVYDLSKSGIPYILRARNNAACLGTKMYVGGGGGGYAPTSHVSNSVFHMPAHGLRDGYEFTLYPDEGQPAMPLGMTYGQSYVVRDATADSFRIAHTNGGAAMTVVDKSPIRGSRPQYNMWSIDLSDRRVERVSSEWGMGLNDHYPQLVADTTRNRLVLIGKKVSAFDPVTKKWSDIPVEGWPPGGFKSAVGAYSAHQDAVFFRGTPTLGHGAQVPWQWNSITFSGSKSK